MQVWAYNDCYKMFCILFQMKNAETQNCLDTLSRKSGENVGMSYCHGLGGNQVSRLCYDLNLSPKYYSLATN